MPDSPAAWNEFRSLTLGYVVTLSMAVCTILLAILVGLFTHHHRGALIAVLILLVFWSTPLFVFTRRFAVWLCPHCGHPFVGFRGLLQVFPTKCSHCGQRAFTELD